MATLVVQSRFAGLKIEDDEPASRDTQKPKKAKTNSVGANIKKTDTAKKGKNTNTKAQGTAQPQKKKKGKGAPATAQQWEQWKQKDEQLVDGNYEKELEQAILLSTLEYQEKQSTYKQSEKEANVEKKAAEQASKAHAKKQKKKNVMSLDQFNGMVSGANENKALNSEADIENEEAKAPEKDTEFFERINSDTKNELIRDKIIDNVKNRLAVSESAITRAQFADAIEKKDEEIDTLKDEVKTLKTELLAVKTRNKKLCNILGQCEMKDKAEVVVEVERLRGVQAELTAEVQALHAQLQRERSRNPDTRPRDKKKKNSTSEKEK